MDKRVINQCTVVLTRDCNLRCNFCYVKNAGYCTREMINYDDLKKIVEFCCDAQAKFIFFSGGEPLLYPHLSDILLYIKQQKYQMKTAIASNGVLLEDYHLCNRLIDNGLDYIDISIKGNNSQEWVNVTGYNGYYKQLQAIKNLSSLPIDFTCSMVLTFENVFFLCESVKIAIENGAKQFSFTFVIDNDNYSDENVFYLESHNPFKLIEAFISQMNQLNKITEDWWIEYSFPMCAYTENQLNILQGRLAAPCQMHKKNSITFDTQLNLLPCDMYFNNKIGKLGKDFVTVEDFVELKNKNPYKNTIESISKLPSENCKKCQYLEQCYGGCPVLWKNYSFEELSAYKEKYK